MIAPADSAFEQRIERIAVGEAQPVVGSEGDAARRLDRRDRFVQAERGDQIGPLARRHDDDHRSPSVAGREVAPEKAINDIVKPWARSEEHTSELQSLMRISYAAVFLEK